jgi:hypothetical protein
MSVSAEAQRFDLKQLSLVMTKIMRWSPDCCWELRAINWSDPRSDPDHRYETTVSGYYDDPRAMVRDAARLSGAAEGVYFVSNPIRRDLICRCKNRLRWRPRSTTMDDHVLRRTWLLIDCDVKRTPPVPGISSTNQELLKAVKRAMTVRDFLTATGHQGLITAASGNGAHVLMRVDLPNDVEHLNKCREVLERLTAKFSDEEVMIDVTTHNAARLVRLYGTMACKGSHCPEEGRPHRIAKIIDIRE